MKEILNTMELDMTARAQAVRDFAPLVIGDNWYSRFQVKDKNKVAVSLSGATIEVFIFGNGITFTRKTGQTIPGTVTNQVAIDADQSAVSVDLKTGKGWFEVRTAEGDRAALAPFVGIPLTIKIVITWSDGTKRTFVRGPIDVLS